MEAEDDSEGSEVAENLCRSKSRAVYQKSPIQPEKFPDKVFDRRELWVKHYKSVVKAHGWSDMQTIEAHPACQTSWAVEVFATVTRQYVVKVQGRRRNSLTWFWKSWNLKCNNTVVREPHDLSSRQ